MIREIRYPSRLMPVVEGAAHFGYDQDWYPEKRQRLAGCGPTVAASMMAYLEWKEWELPTHTREEILYRMLRLWQYTPPRLFGLYKTAWMKDGLQHYMDDKGLAGTVEALPISFCNVLRPKAERVCAFLWEAMEADCPVAFLNLHSGGEPISYPWHWMLLVRLEEGEKGLMATVWDEGKEWMFSVNNWLTHSKLGGGFVRILGTSRQFD